MSELRLGFIVNPVAGIGGRVGLKGSDGKRIQQKALRLGAAPISPKRSIEALKRLEPIINNLDILTYPGSMGEDEVISCGFTPIVIGKIKNNETTGEDTKKAAQMMDRLDVGLIMFAGGDGTARDIYNAIGDSLPVIGIPTGVKIHSAVFAINPSKAGELAKIFLKGDLATLRESEVMDIDEESYRKGHVEPRLYGFLKIPFGRNLIQSSKSPSIYKEGDILKAIALDIIDRMSDRVIYIVGPGTTTRSIMNELGLVKTLIGVDVILGKKILMSDVNEADLLKLAQTHEAKIIVTPIGGQGFLFGRGNQQISPRVIQMIGKDNIEIISTVEKLISFKGLPLLVDTGDKEVDDILCGYMEVITGYRERIIYPVKT
jgi:predicted polyphosphate/ATP-dependent NAD kinase